MLANQTLMGKIYKDQKFDWTYNWKISFINYMFLYTEISMFNFSTGTLSFGHY